MTHSRAALPAAAQHALVWLGTQGQHFSPPGVLSTGAAKPAVELALMLGVITKPGASSAATCDPAVSKLVDLIETIGQRPDVRSRPAKSTSDVLLRAAIHAVLEWSGRPVADHRDVVNHAVAAGVVDHAERFPYQLMEERLVLEWAGLEPDLPSFTELAAQSMLSRRLRAFHLTRRTAYQLTHDIMFLAALDPGSSIAADAVDAENLRRVIADLIVSFAARSHWDLLGELLLCWDCLHLPPDRIHDRAWALLLSQQSVDGSFPGPPPPRGADPDPVEGLERFGHRYHTTLVMVLALHGRARRAVVAGDPHHGRPRRRRAVRSEAAAPAAAVQQDVEWLHQLLDGPGASAPAVSSGVLVGTWLCAAVDPLVAPTIPVMAQRVAELLDGAARYETAPPALTLTAHALLHRSGLIVPGLARFVDQVRAVLAAEPPRSAAMDVTRCEKRILLHQLGLADSPPLMTPAMARSTIVGMTLQPDPEQRTDAVLAAESATGHGTVASDDEPSAAVLERHAVHQYRSGDLAAGCALVRAAHHLRPLATERAGEFIDHLLLNRRSGGGYGYLPAIGDHSADLDLDLDVRLHLPTTLTCLWTVAELNSDFRLYRSLMGVHHVGFGQSGV